MKVALKELLLPVPHFGSVQAYKKLLGVLSKKDRKKKRANEMMEPYKFRAGSSGVRLAKSKLAKSSRRQGPQPKHEKTFTWGKFTFTFCKPSHGSWPAYSVTCPVSNSLHRSNLKLATGCKRRRGFKDEEGEAITIVRLKAWLLATKDCCGRLEHQLWEPKQEDLEKATNARPPKRSDTGVVRKRLCPKGTENKSKTMSERDSAPKRKRRINGKKSCAEFAEA